MDFGGDGVFVCWSGPIRCEMGHDSQCPDAVNVDCKDKFRNIMSSSSVSGKNFSAAAREWLELLEAEWK